MQDLVKQRCSRSRNIRCWANLLSYVPGDSDDKENILF